MRQKPKITYMELKEFIETVLMDITSAVKASQDNIKNGAIINPKGIKSNGTKEGLPTKGIPIVTPIDFEVSVGTSSVSESGMKGAVTVLSGMINGGIISRLKGKQESENASRVKFTIPVVLPWTQAFSGELDPKTDQTDSHQEYASRKNQERFHNHS